MAEERRWTAEKLVAEMPRLLAELKAAARARVHEVERGKGRSGVYAIFDGQTCVYVGRTSKHGNRLRSHSRPSAGENSAPLAFRLTRESLNPKTGYKPGQGTREDLISQPLFRETFDRWKECIRSMHFIFIEVEDGPLQAMFEIYAAIALGARHSEFRNH